VINDLPVISVNLVKFKTLLDLDYEDDLSILYGSFSRIKEFLKYLNVQGARIGLKINVKKTKSLKLGKLLAELLVTLQCH